MKRREFLRLLGGAAAAWPLAARAQQTAVPVIGFLNPTEFDYRVAAFRQGLEETGDIEDQNVLIEYRWAEGQLHRLPALAADLVRRKIAVIAATGGQNVTRAAKAATSAIPIVFTMAADPVASGVVDSLNRPRGNVTGIGFLTGSLRAKQVEMLREAVPNAKVIGYLSRPFDTLPEGDLEVATAALGLKLVAVKARTPNELEGAFASPELKRSPSHPAPPSTTGVIISCRSIPAIYPDREYTAAGGLMSYGASVAEAYRLAGTYTGRILKGEKPGDLPVQLSTKVELIINAKAATALGLAFPLTLLGRADEVIE